MEISWMAKLIVHQQDMSVNTLVQLREYGVIEDSTLLRLDFSYNALGESGARALVDFLHHETSYDVEIVRGRHSGFRRGWRVIGQTPETPIPTDTINNWIRWMVLAGSECGQCRFDGWGAEVPATP